MGPYIVDGHFMYGNTFCMPRPPYYNTICHHRAPSFRGFPYRMVADRAGDGVGYSEPEGYSEDGEDCTSVVRSSSLPNVTAVTAKKITTLRIKIWGVKEDDDYYVDMEVGSRYAITYMVPGGYAIADGYLEYIDSSVSDGCTKYTGNYDEDVVQAYIGLDCSTTGNSDKRKIYIASIRKIEALEADESYDSTVEDEDTDTEKMLKRIIHMLDTGMVFMTEDRDTSDGDDKDDDLEIWDIGGGHKGDDCKPGGGFGFDVSDEESFTAAEQLLEDLDEILKQCRFQAIGTLLTEEVDEKTNDGTEESVRNVGDISVQIELLEAKIEEYAMGFAFDHTAYTDIDDIPKSVKQMITKKISLIIRYMVAINNGFGMVEEDDETE